MQMQTIVAIGIQVDKKSNTIEQTEAIDETKFKIESDICRRRTILDALDFVTRSGCLIYINKYREDLVNFMKNKTLLAYDLLREAPLHLR
jgi:hypothetical protein